MRIRLFEKGVHSNEKNHDPCGGPLHIDIHQAGLNTGFSYDGFHLTGDVVEAVMGRGGYLDALLHALFLSQNQK